MFGILVCTTIKVKNSTGILIMKNKKYYVKN